MPSVIPAGRKPTFESGGAFITETRRDVEEYLSSGRTRIRGRVQLYAKGVVAFAVMLASWAVVMLADPRPWLGLLGLAGLVVGTSLTAFCVMHDANHGSYFGSRRFNHLMGWTSDSLLGMSSYAWRVKHNIAHHTYTNVDGYDADITQVPVARFMPVQEPRSWYRLQHFYIWPLYGLMGLRWQTIGDAAALFRGGIGRSSLRMPRGWDLAGLTAGKAFFVCWAIALPMLVYPWWVVLAGYFVFSVLVSLIMAVTFQLAHCVEEADFFTAEELSTERRVWAVHEVETTVDFCPRNRVLTWMLGGLNFQIEHHLFPGVPHTHYARIAEIVQRNAQRHGVRYTVHGSLRAALRSHYRHLRETGRMGLPVEIEMG
jgi:linoleoyl-CoA desaturase